MEGGAREGVSKGGGLGGGRLALCLPAPLCEAWVGGGLIMPQASTVLVTERGQRQGVIVSDDLPANSSGSAHKLGAKRVREADPFYARVPLTRAHTVRGEDPCFFKIFVHKFYTLLYPLITVSNGIIPSE